MFYKLLIVVVVFSTLYGDDFDRLISSPTQEMLQSMKGATLCESPAIAKEDYSSSFKYGCFCGKNYPNLISKTKKSYKRLNREEQDALIAKYYSIKPYDDIDALCMKHDICYISKGREDQLCNDVLYDSLGELSRGFYEIAKEKGVESKATRCEKLSSDVAVVFKTVFGLNENRSLMRFGIFTMINTPMTVVSKGIQNTSHGISDRAVYPLEGEKCNLILKD